MFTSSASATPAPTTAGGGFRLLVVDPHQQSAELTEALRAHDVDVVVCGDPAEALLEVGSTRPDAVLAAPDLQPLDTVTLVRVLARRCGVPVLLGVGDHDGDHAAAALTAGATACVARPYRPQEVLPILRAIRPDTGAAMDQPLHVGVLRLNPATLEVHLRDRPIRLPLREFRLLHMLMVNADRVVTREQIHAEVWKNSTIDSSNTLTVHVQRLRARLGDDPNDSKIILTARGMGYRLVPPPATPRSPT